MNPEELSSRFSFRSLTPQLFGLVILPLTILLLVIAFGGISLHQQAMRTLVAERDERAVRSAAQTLQEQLNHRATAVRTLALRVREGMPVEDLAGILQTDGFPPPEFDLGLAFLARGGEVLASTGDRSLWENFDPSADPEVKTQLARDVPPTFLQLSHPAGGATVIFVTAPSFKGGPVAVGAFSPAELARRVLAGGFTPGEKAVAFMLDGEKRLLYQVGGLVEDESPAGHPGVREALAGSSGASFLDVAGSEHVIAYSPVLPVGWVLIIEEPWATVASPLLRTTENAPLILVPALVLAVFALWFGFRQVVQPLQKLERLAAAVGRGDFDAIEEPVGGVAEIQHLHAGLVALAGKVQAAQQGLHGFIGAMTTGQEEERRRLARELHDDTLQALIALNQRVQLARLSLNDGDAAAQLAEIEELIGQTIANLRRITRALRPIYLDELGLVAALETLVRETSQTAGSNIHFHLIGEQRRLSSTEELAFYRIAQEAVNNVLRHAQATVTRLELIFDERYVRLMVTDDGRGFSVPESPAALTPHGHFGLLSLHERADLIAARLEIKSSPRKGTQISVTLPVQG